MKHLFLITDLIMLALIISGISIFQNQADIVLLVFWFVIAIYTLSLKRYKSFFHLLISTSIAFVWVFIARDNYGYNYNYIRLGGMNLLAIMSWALGMIGILEIFSHFTFKSKLLRFLVFVSVFWILLILVESYAFHVIRIRNTSTGTNIGLPFCDCIHAPWWMRLVYFTLGPVYYLLANYADRYTNRAISGKATVNPDAS